MPKLKVNELIIIIVVICVVHVHTRHTTTQDHILKLVEYGYLNNYKICLIPAVDDDIYSCFEWVRFKWCGICDADAEMN